ncbi:MAG TPA: ribose-phosphate diphosphokinase [Candidatus Absconditabacterales bacterium]|nr:ribose-phosphate diphosphokinase [Candidatus Absconditabacterales bacterium]
MMIVHPNQKMVFNDKLHIIGVEGTDAIVNKIVAQLRVNFTTISKEIVPYMHFANGEAKVELSESVRGKFTYLICDRYGKYSSQDIKYNDRLMQELLLVQCAKNHGAKGISMGGMSESNRKGEGFLPIYNQAESFQSIFGPMYSTNTLETSSIDLLNPETKLVQNVIKEFEAKNRMLPNQKEKIHLIGTQDTMGLVASMQAYLVNALGSDVVSSETSLYKESSLGITEIDLKNSFAGKHVYVVGDVNGKKNVDHFTISYNDRLVQLFLLLKYARDYAAKTVNVIPTCFPYSRQDKPTQGGLKERVVREPSSAQFMIDILQDTFGVDYCLTMDIHNPAVINNSIETNFVNLYTGWMIQHVSDILKKEGKNDLIIAPMDEGGLKKVSSIAKDLQFNYLTVIKTRDYSKINSVDEIFVHGDVQGKNILIHDDILDTGGSLIKLVQKLHELGARSVNIAITHGMFNNDALDKLQLLYEQGLFEHIYVSNTVYRDIDLYPDFIKVVDASINFADPIKSIYSGESINYNYGVTPATTQ